MEIVLPIPHFMLCKTLVAMNYAGHLEKNNFVVNIPMAGIFVPFFQVN